MSILTDIEFDEIAECRCGVNVGVTVKIPPDLSSTGEVKWKQIWIDACIADIVSALQQAGIDMRASCCGHGGAGRIDLEDGRILTIIWALA